MRVLTISILFLLLLGFASAKNISVSYSSEVSQEETFKISLSLMEFPADTYDVKIDITEGATRPCKIENSGTFKSTYYFVNEIISDGETKDFALVCSQTGDFNIEFKIKDSKDKSTSFTGYSIKVNGNSNPEPTENSLEQVDEITQDFESPEETISKENSNSVAMTSSVISEEQKTEPIKLSPQTIKTQENSEKKKGISLWAFVLFIFMLGLLFLLKYLFEKGKYKNEFR